MNFNDFLDLVILQISDYNFRVSNLLGLIIVFIIVSFLFYLVANRLLPKYFEKREVVRKERSKVNWIIRNIFLLLLLIGGVWALELNYVLFNPPKPDKELGDFTIKINTILQALLVLQAARFVDWMISRAVIYNFEHRDDKIVPLEEKIKEQKQEQEQKKIQSSTTSSVQLLVYIICAIILIQIFNLDYDLVTYKEYTVTVSAIFIALLVLVFAQLFTWILTQIILHGYYHRQRVDVGTQYAINRLLKYFIFVVAFIIVIENLGVQLTVLWGGAAALLVGVGLGLQQTFNDLISGIILLFERTVEVGDIVQIDGLVGTVQKIGLRTSLVESRENITIVVPNSKLIVDNVVNWSHFDKKARFDVAVGVAYGSDTKLVKQILLEVAKANDYVFRFPAPFVRFIDFGASSLDFKLYFWSHELLMIEDVKSDIRFLIDQKFRENGVEIPFPQRDVWFKNPMQTDNTKLKKEDQIIDNTEGDIKISED